MSDEEYMRGYLMFPDVSILVAEEKVRILEFHQFDIATFKQIQYNGGVVDIPGVFIEGEARIDRNTLLEIMYGDNYKYNHFKFGNSKISPSSFLPQNLTSSKDNDLSLDLGKTIVEYMAIDTECSFHGFLGEFLDMLKEDYPLFDFGYRYYEQGKAIVEIARSKEQLGKQGNILDVQKHIQEHLHTKSEIYIPYVKPRE